jgi:hypothetical protein
VLHSDGYANDPSPTAERRKLLQLAAEIAALPGVFIDTVAYRDWADYKLLAEMAHMASGRCVQAFESEQVFEALRGTAEQLAGGVLPSVDCVVPTGEYGVFVSCDGGKVLGSLASFQVRGLTAGQDAVLYTFRPVDVTTWAASSAQLIEDDFTHRGGLFAYSRAMLAEGNLMEAKYALAGTKDSVMLSKWARALTNTQVRDFAKDLEDAITAGCLQVGDSYGLPCALLSVLDVVALLETEPWAIEVDTKHLIANYTRRGVKKLAGTRQEDGTIVPPAYDLVWKEPHRWVQVAGFERNHDTANLNMRLVFPAKLVEASTGKVVKRVAGIDVADLKDYRNYTLVGDGEVNVPSLVVRIKSKRLFRALAAAGVVSGAYNPAVAVTIDLSSRPVVPYGVQLSADGLTGLFGQVARLTFVASMIRALLPGESAVYTDEQVAALKVCHLTPALYYSAPTTVPYTDRKAAIAAGQIDVRLSYRVAVGNKEVLNLDALYSGNEYLKRRFEVKLPGAADVEKSPKLPMLWQQGVIVTEKALSARTKLDAVDAMTMPLLTSFLGLVDSKEADVVIGNDEGSLDSLRQALRAKDRERGVEALTELKGIVDKRLDALWSVLVPLAFYVGSSGLLPDGFADVQALDADGLKAACPSLKLGKKEADGTFFLLGDSVLSIFAEQVDFSTGR